MSKSAKSARQLFTANLFLSSFTGSITYNISHGSMSYTCIILHQRQPKFRRLSLPWAQDKALKARWTCGYEESCDPEIASRAVVLTQNHSCSCCKTLQVCKCFWDRAGRIVWKCVKAACNSMQSPHMTNVLSNFHVITSHNEWLLRTEPMWASDQRLRSAMFMKQQPFWSILHVFGPRK